MKSADLILKMYKKNNILQVYSGTLAIESILKTLNLEPNSTVLISSFTCYSILEAILNSNLKPIIAIPKNGIVFSKEELKELINKNHIAVYICVHQYGYYQPYLKNENVIIIEDFSQAWNLQTNNSINNSDFIVLSLGKTKPLSNGIGGIILSDKNIEENFDMKNRNDRYKNNNLLEYYYPQNINYKKLIWRANRIVKKQRHNAKVLDKIFENYCFINTIDTKNTLPSYHRYVISIDAKEVDELCLLFKKINIKYQKEFKIKLNKVPIVTEKNIKVIGNNTNNVYLLFKANNTILKLKKLQREMRKKYGTKLENNLC